MIEHAEKAVLGVLLLDATALARVGDLRTEHFAEPDHRGPNETRFLKKTGFRSFGPPYLPLRTKRTVLHESFISFNPEGGTMTSTPTAEDKDIEETLAELEAEGADIEAAEPGGPPLFSGWSREGYWQDGVLYSARGGAQTYPEAEMWLERDLLTRKVEALKLGTSVIAVALMQEYRARLAQVQLEIQRRQV